MTNRAVIMLCPEALAPVANAAFAKLGIGPSTLTAPYAAPSTPETISHRLCHWNNPSTTMTATVGQMVSGTLPTDCLNEFDQPISITWDDPSESAALEAMAAIIFKSVPYDSPSPYNSQAEVASLVTLAGLIRWQDPEGGEE